MRRIYSLDLDERSNLAHGLIDGAGDELEKGLEEGPQARLEACLAKFQHWQQHDPLLLPNGSGADALDGLFVLTSQAHELCQATEEFLLAVSERGLSLVEDTRRLHSELAQLSSQHQQLQSIITEFGALPPPLPLPLPPPLPLSLRPDDSPSEQLTGSGVRKRHRNNPLPDVPLFDSRPAEPSTSYLVDDPDSSFSSLSASSSASSSSFSHPIDHDRADMAFPSLSDPSIPSASASAASSSSMLSGSDLVLATAMPASSAAEEERFVPVPRSDKLLHALQPMDHSDLIDNLLELARLNEQILRLQLSDQNGVTVEADNALTSLNPFNPIDIDG